MPYVIPVKFAFAARDLWFDPRDSDAQEGDHVICSTERGTEIGLATGSSREVSKAELNRMIGNANLKPVLRVADDDDLDRAEELAQRGDDAFPTFRKIVHESGLDMKPVGVEYLFGGEKVVCYFAAEERVDFRQLVRDLSHELHERIDMRQIGVREEAAVIGGFGHCGQELCCARFGLTFEPVSIRMAKEQDLPLTSNKISGACGRLMCCLRYEFEAYRDFKGRAPKRNAVIDTPLGKAKIVEYDTPKEQLCLRIENGKTIRIPLAEMVASEAAVKKSEELHCPCRPDTVVRESLDKLNSPDVQMALAELDRKAGIIPTEEFDNEADLFDENKARRRRRRTNGNATQSAQKPTSEQAPRRRRRRGGSNSGTGAQGNESQLAPAEQKPATEPTEKRSRRRRRKRAGSGTNVEQTPSVAAETTNTQQTGQTKNLRRRHHRSDANAGSSQASAQSQPKQGKNNKQQPRRRPGDRKGQEAQQKEERRKASQAQGSENKTATGEQPKRRRRRRSRGRGGNGSGPSGDTQSS